jgi:hypothetical protein
VIWLAGLIVVTATARILLTDPTGQAPWVFYDELGYQKLAQSLGQSGQLALFGKQGLTYSPLYPLVLSPLYAFHLSGTHAYGSILVVNCLLLALASVPIYVIARYVLSPARAVVAVALSSLAPLMLLSSFVLSENLAYPLFFFAVWATLVAVRKPGIRADAVVLGICFICTATRLQFAGLFPAALTAVLLAAIVDGRVTGRRLRRSLWWALRKHWLLAVANSVLVVGAIAARLGSGVLALTGRYANQRHVPAPSPWRIIDLVAQHVAGLDLTTGVIPFVGTLAAAVLWARHIGRAKTDAFAAVAASVTFFLVITTAFASYGQSYIPGGEVPRIHERYLIYLVPLFVIAMVATAGIPRSVTLLRIGLAAAVVGALLPIVIPFGTVINHTIGIDSFGLLAFATNGKHGVVEAIRHAKLTAVLSALCLGSLYALARPKPVIVFAVVAMLLVSLSFVVRGDQRGAGRRAAVRAFSGQRNWVDSAVGSRHVLMIEHPRLVLAGLGEAETAFFNLTVSRLYFPCVPILSGEFGEHQVELGSGGRLLDQGVPVRAGYAVVPADHGIEGRVVATDLRARLVLVEPNGGVLRVAPASRDRWACTPSRSSSLSH